MGLELEGWDLADLELELEWERASWCQQHWQPTVSLGNQTMLLLLVHEALQIANQCYPRSRTWCRNEGKMTHQAVLRCTRRTHQVSLTRREHQQVGFLLKWWEVAQLPCSWGCTNWHNLPSHLEFRYDLCQ